MSADPDASAPHLPASRGFVTGAILIGWLIQIALYWPTTQALPFGDDWGVPLAEILRGEQQGPWSFFAETRQPDSYRPVQSLLMWLVARGQDPQPWFAIRMLHFACAGLLLVSLGLMLRGFRVGMAGVVVATIVAVVHPTLVAPIGGIDGFSSTLSCAFVWFGAWGMIALRNRPLLGAVFAGAALIAGTLVKEYAFAATPLAVLAAWCFSDRRWRDAAIAAGVLSVLTLALLWARRFTKPADMAVLEADFQFGSLQLIGQNLLLVIAGGLFFGDSLAVYVERSGLVIGVSGIVFGLALFYIVGGWWRIRDVPRTDDRITPSRILLFLVISFLAVTFPANLVMRMSEMYLCGLVVSVALLMAFAADGWERKRDAIGAASWFVVLGLTVAACVAVVHKMEGMLTMGELAREQAEKLIQVVRSEPQARRVKILYNAEQLRPRPTFSSYRLADCYLIRPTADEILFPERDIGIECVKPLPDETAVLAADRSDADIVLYWDVFESRYQRLK